MDPVANLKRQRELVAEVIALYEANTEEDGSIEFSHSDAHELASAANELAELVQALDEWRLKGGFDPYEASARATWSRGN